METLNNVELPDRVIIYKGELEYISRCILDYPDIETGGNLFGFYTAFRVPVIQYVLGPGKKSEHSREHFRQDADFFNIQVDMLIKEHALNHIGTWHSHHRLGLDHPSGGDSASVVHGMKHDGLNSCVLVIGTLDERGTSAHAYSFSMRNCRTIKWVILDDESPIRKQFDNKHWGIINPPHTARAAMAPLESVPMFGDAAKKIIYPKGYWLNDEANIKELKLIIHYLKTTYKKVFFYQQAEERTVKIVIEDIGYEFIFPNEFPRVPPLIRRDGKVLADDLEWVKNGTISQMVIEYVKRSSQYDGGTVKKRVSHTPNKI